MTNKQKDPFNEIAEKNNEKFAAIKKLKLPLGHYLITGSGALGIRGLREINDIDIVVSTELWETLIKKYEVTNEGHLKKITFPDGIVEAIGESSFYDDLAGIGRSVEDRIARADIIDGLPFESLEDVLFFKRKMSREKDLKDILLIEKALKKEWT